MDYLDILISAAAILLAIFLINLYMKAIQSDNHTLEFMYSTADRFFVFFRIYNSGGDSDSFYTWRFRVHAVESGKRIFRSKELFGDSEVIGVTGEELVWMISGKDRIAAFHLYRLVYVFDKQLLYKDFPDLQKADIISHYLDLSNNHLYFSTNQGYHYRIDYESFEVSKVDKARPKENSGSEEKIKKPKNEGFSIRKTSNSERYGLFYKQDRILKEHSFLNPVILVDSIKKAPMAEEGENAVFILHQQTLDEGSDFIISKCTEDQLCWSLHQESLPFKKDGDGKKVKFITEVNQQALACIENLLLLVDLETGRVVWQQKI